MGPSEAGGWKACLPDIAKHEAANTGDHAEEDGEGRDLLLSGEARGRRALWPRRAMLGGRFVRACDRHAVAVVRWQVR